MRFNNDFALGIKSPAPESDTDRRSPVAEVIKKVSRNVTTFVHNQNLGHPILSALQYSSCNFQGRHIAIPTIHDAEYEMTVRENEIALTIEFP
ncbi:MAG: hypothetical protein KBA40_04070, partial [Candidatus Peribacteraceae bacterium]|nr:hypothetical protein [Candidatus Peribacteraceae bacterium]